MKDIYIHLDRDDGRYETLKRYYGKWLRTEGADQLEKLARLVPSVADRRNPATSRS